MSAISTGAGNVLCLASAAVDTVNTEKEHPPVLSLSGITYLKWGKLSECKSDFKRYSEQK